MDPKVLKNREAALRMTGWSDYRNLTPDRQQAVDEGRIATMPMQCQHWQSTYSLNAVPGGKNSRCPHSVVTAVRFWDAGTLWTMYVCQAHAEQMRREEAKAARAKLPGMRD